MCAVHMGAACSKGVVLHLTSTNAVFSSFYAIIYIIKKLLKELYQTDKILL